MTIYGIEDFPPDCIAECSASGRVDAEVDYWQHHLDFKVPRAEAIKCLYGYGAWELAELNALSDDELAQKVLWLACGTFAEGDAIFCLE